MGRLGRFSFDRIVASESKQEYGATKLRDPLWYASRTATSKAMLFYQHTKVLGTVAVDNVNMSGGTGSFNQIWGGMMFPSGATVGVTATAFTFDGATLIVPRLMGTTGRVINFVLLGSR